MGYVWHRNRNEQLSRQIRDTTARLEQMRTANLVLDRQLEELRSPRSLEAAIRHWNLGLVMPQPEQILRISEAPPGTALAVPRSEGPPPRLGRPRPSRRGT